MKKFYILVPGVVSLQLNSMIEVAKKNIADPTVIDNLHNLPDFRNTNILLAVELNHIGVNTLLLEIMSRLHERGPDSLKGTTAGILLRSPNELYTKNFAKDIVFLANQIGCSFPGHPLVEATGSLNNFLTWQKQYTLPLEEICNIHCIQLVERILNNKLTLAAAKPKIVALHSSSRHTSNTLMLWDLIKNHLTDMDIEEIHVENGTVLDCIGCSYKTCMHYSMQNSCFYGGFMIREVLPAIEKADILVWVCPNYNDSISANLMAVVNRLTSLYRKTKLYDKTFYSVIVSGNSGSDSVAKQLIDALNINKGLGLPPYFTIMATANDPGSILNVPDIEKKAFQFAKNILRNIKGLSH